MPGWRAWGRGRLRNAGLTVTFANTSWGLGGSLAAYNVPAADTRLALCPAKHPKLLAAFRVERPLLQVVSGGGRAAGAGLPLAALGGLDGPRHKHFTASSENTAPLLPKSFPVSSAVCLLFPARRAGRMAARRRLLPYPTAAGGRGRDSRGATPLAGAHGPGPQPPSAPLFPGTGPSLSHLWGLHGAYSPAQTPPVPTPCKPLMQMHNPPPFHLPFTFSPAFAANISPPPGSLPLPSQLIFLPCPRHLLSLGFLSLSIIPLLPFPISARSLAPSTYSLFLCFSCPQTLFPSVPSHVSHPMA